MFHSSLQATSVQLQAPLCCLPDQSVSWLLAAADELFPECEPQIHFIPSNQWHRALLRSRTEALPMSHSSKLTVARLVTEFLNLYNTEVYYPNLSQINSFRTTSSYLFNIHIVKIFMPLLPAPNASLCFENSDKIFVNTVIPCTYAACCMYILSHWLDRHHIWWRVQIMNFLIIELHPSLSLSHIFPSTHLPLSNNIPLHPFPSLSHIFSSTLFPLFHTYSPPPISLSATKDRNDPIVIGNDTSQLRTLKFSDIWEMTNLEIIQNRIRTI
jgi:hypothetical protein